MQFLTETNIDFMKYRVPLAVASLALAVFGLLYVLVLGRLNVGIDFAGGTQVTLRFLERPDVDRIRGVLAEAGFPAAQIQRFGEEDANEVLIRTATVEGSEEGSANALLAALDASFNAGLEEATDINRQSGEVLGRLLTRLDPERILAPGADPSVVPEAYRSAAASILELRRQEAMVSSWDQIQSLEAVTPAIREALENNAHIGNLAILAVENVGPQIGQELKRQGILAVVLSLIGMLLYIWLRFEFRFGLGAVVAIFHDVAVTIGLFALAGYEFNITTIAAFLTLVGYSVNDTVVVFDRVRENLRRSRRESLREILNNSLNQTLSRTVMTSGTTLLVILTLYLFGGDVLRGFAFILMVGIIVGTYSSIWVASPVVLVWEKYFGREARAARAKIR